jgi:hemolysin activation/secretion protein
VLTLALVPPLSASTSNEQQQQEQQEQEQEQEQEQPPLRAPDVWLLPLTYDHVQNASGAVIGTSVRVRGSRRGRLCTLRWVAAARQSLHPRLLSMSLLLSPYEKRQRMSI